MGRETEPGVGIVLENAAAKRRASDRAARSFARESRELARLSAQEDIGANGIHDGAKIVHLDARGEQGSILLDREVKIDKGANGQSGESGDALKSGRRVGVHGEGKAVRKPGNKGVVCGVD